MMFLIFLRIATSEIHQTDCINVEISCVQASDSLAGKDMKRLTLTTAACGAPFALLHMPAKAFSPAVSLRVAELQASALTDETASRIVESLTTEIGPRLAGTTREAQARAWAVRMLESLAFTNVRVEPFDMPVWVRGEEHAELLHPFPQRLMLTALGNSAATPSAGITGRVLRFKTLAELDAAAPADIRGTIVFIDQAMTATQDGSHYGQFGGARRLGPSIASRKGAAAILIRSLGTGIHRKAHTGVVRWIGDVPPIPAAALTLPDADQLTRVLARGEPTTLRLTLTPRDLGKNPSGNVIAEVRGTDPKAGVVLVGAHLDSWDQGTGAIDNAAGVAIISAAAKLVQDSGKPRRTIRIVLFGAEEVGGLGSAAYRAAHKDDNIVLVAESDFGADRVWRVDLGLAPNNTALGDRTVAVVAPLGIARGREPASAGVDLNAWVRAGTAAIDLQQDGMRYFDLHHTPDDTFDKIDHQQLRQNVAAWTTMLWEVANAPETIEPVRQP